MPKLSATLPARAMTGLVGEIEGVIGTHLVTALLAQHGGTTISVPVTSQGSSMAYVIGQEATDAMIRHFGPGRISLPLADVRGTAERRQRGLVMIAEGASITEVALACEVTERTVCRWKQAMRDGRAAR